ncbi:MAG: hypothetical protein M1829_005976 [Trizodia sp. TS-e1964]|nr:MAG: hypothetical protein M1829_005976 [Trizodia sp. TS-e1964]
MTNNTCSDLTEPLYQYNIPYNGKISNEMQTLSTCIPASTTDDQKQKLWVIYIHGGAWRDYRSLSDTFGPSLKILLEDLAHRPYIAGFATVNYRLSPYPKSANNVDTPQGSPFNALHPDHILDVMSAVKFLQTNYNFGEQYLLVGHSAGATLAFQLGMGCWKSAQEPLPKMPLGILGISGIYDLLAFRDNHLDQPIYHEILQGAFGPNENIWKESSPAFCDFTSTWPSGRLALVASSPEDELVEAYQAELMVRKLKEITKGSTLNCVEVKLAGKHDQIWREGKEIARTIGMAIDLLQAHD